jgi:pimeloyl-ACP methyl ester carboxylesterase
LGALPDAMPSPDWQAASMTTLDRRPALSATAPHIAFDDIGSGDPAVVLLHGLFEDRTYYRAQAQHLAARHRVLNIDLRGHGESDVPEQGYSLDVHGRANV